MKTVCCEQVNGLVSTCTQFVMSPTGALHTSTVVASRNNDNNNQCFLHDPLRGQARRSTPGQSLLALVVVSHCLPLSKLAYQKLQASFVCTHPARGFVLAKC